MYNSLHYLFLSFVLFYIVFFLDLMFFDLMRSFLIFGNSSSLVFIFIELNFIISFFLNPLKYFFQIFMMFAIFALYFFVKIL